MSYPKYLLEQKLGRPLCDNETCDHKDDDFTNNDLDNLQVLSRRDNTLKGLALRPAQLATFTCPVCSASFTKEMRRIKDSRKQGKSGPYCSKSCAGKGSHPSNKAV